MFLLLGCGSNAVDDTVLDAGKDASTQDVVNPNDSSPPPDGSPGCGTCPAGYTCKTANGLQVCRSSTSNIPLFSHVFVIVMENTSLSTLQTAMTGGKAPTLASWAANYASASDYHGVDHPSLPNYIALTSGDTQGIGCDCKAEPGQGSCNVGTCNLVLGLCTCTTGAQNLGDQLENANKTWMDFGEDMGTPCNLSDSGNYAVRHNPFLYYTDVQSDSARCNAHVVDFSSFSPSSAPSFSFIAPNLVDDMHNPDPPNSTNIPNGDTWLGVHAGAILASDSYKQGGLLVVVWDEDDGSGGITGTDDPIGLFVMSPYAKSGGYVSTGHADHYSLLATIEDGLDLGRIGSAAQAQPLADFFPTQ
jgi:hypothetical protein